MQLLLALQQLILMQLAARALAVRQGLVVMLVHQVVQD
jgi:hypothetical protein